MSPVNRMKRVVILFSMSIVLLNGLAAVTIDRRPSFALPALPGMQDSAGTLQSAMQNPLQALTTFISTVHPLAPVIAAAQIGDTDKDVLFSGFLLTNSIRLSGIGRYACESVITFLPLHLQLRVFQPDSPPGFIILLLLMYIVVLHRSNLPGGVFCHNRRIHIQPNLI